MRDVTTFARMLVAAVRSQAMYGAQHPNAVAAAERCRATIPALVTHQGLVIGVTPETLLVNGEPVPADPRLHEAAALLNDHDILRLHVVTHPGALPFANFLLLLTFDPQATRLRGGPARLWEYYNHAWLLIDQIDFDALLAGAAEGSRAVAGRSAPSLLEQLRGVGDDTTWRALVRAMADGRSPLEADAEQRLLDVAGSADAIHALASDAASQADSGTAREAAKAAAVLMTFQRLSSFVELQTPAALPAAQDRIAEAAARTDPAVLVRAAAEAAESGLGADVFRAVGDRFDDQQVATLLAAAMAAEGKATSRMAAALNTLAPDTGRQGRILRLARHTPAGNASSGAADLASMWSALERFLEGPADAAYVSQLYGESLEQAEARSNRIRLDAPPKLDEWVRSVSAESVRVLSVTVLLDLFGLERQGARLMETAKDLAVLTDDLLLASDVGEARRVVDALAAASQGQESERAAAGNGGLTDIRSCPGLREAIQHVDELPAGEADNLVALLSALGPATVPTIVDTLAAMPAGTARDRVADLLVTFGERALDALSDAVAQLDTDHLRTIVQVVERIGGSRAVALLVAWAHSPRPDLMRFAVHGLVLLESPAAGEALATLLRAGSLDARVAVIDALASSHHRTASQLLASALNDVDPHGAEHTLCLRLLAALRLVGTAAAVPAIAAVAARRSWLAWGRRKAVAQAACSVLAGLKVPEARAALETLATRGSWTVRRAARRAAGFGG